MDEYNHREVKVSNGNKAIIKDLPGKIDISIQVLKDETATERVVKPHEYDKLLAQVEANQKKES